MTKQAEFKAAFLEYCADHGLSISDSTRLVKQARAVLRPMTKKAFDPLSALANVAMAPVHLAKAVAPTVLGLGATAAIGLPVVGGLAAGHALAKATDDDTTVEEAKARELLSEYRRWTDQAKRHAAESRLRDVPHGFSR